MNSAGLEALRRVIERIGPALVSFSGGVDSTLLAVVSRDVLGDGMSCAFLDGPLVPRVDAAAAREIARRLDLPIVVIPFDPLEDPVIRANPADRCYRCKEAAVRLLRREAGARGYARIVDGVNTSDLGMRRPGILASTRGGVEHPFVVAGIGKEQVRGISRFLGLDVWDKPSSACLASRIPYGEPLEPGVLSRVERAEDALRGLGFPSPRVRAHGPLARVEVPGSELARAVLRATDIVSALKTVGFAYATLDLAGYRSGAMDEVLGNDGG